MQLATKTARVRYLVDPCRLESCQNGICYQLSTTMPDSLPGRVRRQTCWRRHASSLDVAKVVEKNLVLKHGGDALSVTISGVLGAHAASR
jgi:hypothetical protein